MSEAEQHRWDHAGSRAMAATALVEIAAARPQCLQARSLSSRSKLPFKAALYRDTLLWRIEELARSALRAYDCEDHVSGIILARAAMETIAALNSLHHLVTKYEGGEADRIDDTLMSMLMGSRTRDDRPNALNILGAIDRLTKSLTAMRKLYDELSEYAHPNDCGTASSFAVLKTVPLSATFTRRGEQYDRRAWLLIESMATSLMLVMPLYAELVAAAPQFALRCEADAEGMGG